MMYMPVYLVCAALIIAVKGEELSSSSNYYGGQIEPVDLITEQETMRFLFPRLAKIRPTRNWDEQYYNIPDVQSNSIEQISLSSEGRFKRTEGLKGKPSLSFVNSLDVLRNRLMLEITRKKAQEGVNRNRNLLCKIGKRSPLIDQEGCEDVNDKIFLRKY
ncbi:uncharacterized protein [Onthophagus taurus]|uniref:uncharacterized protein n=1 Tax=Onthophagus taurus TaxID=166361 RepID=UPI000C2001F1|nr:uncharacterized protein LOC111420432 [Onthophagus taurus]